MFIDFFSAFNTFKSDIVINKLRSLNLNFNPLPYAVLCLHILNIDYSTAPKLAVHPHYRNQFIAGQFVTSFLLNVFRNVDN